ncbi:MAG: T9SS type A sorting domain-containing protein [Bacteroidetes bacterium]|nr:T9SS type A sorting domain-containing protein [Bacteroidota bacterium]
MLGTSRYAVLDMLGAVRMAGKIDEGASIDVQRLPAGYYILRLLITARVMGKRPLDCFGQSPRNDGKGERVKKTNDWETTNGLLQAKTSQ